jgi:hypothetical protein
VSGTIKRQNGTFVRVESTTNFMGAMVSDTNKRQKWYFVRVEWRDKGTGSLFRRNFSNINKSVFL